MFDVGVIALAHTATPIRDAALLYVREAITGEIDVVVLYPALFSAHAVLKSYYDHSNAVASRLLDNFMDAKRIRWYDRMSEGLVRYGLEHARTANLDGWDGYNAQVAIDEGVNTVLTIDRDFERIDAFTTEIVLSPDEFLELNRFLED